MGVGICCCSSSTVTISGCVCAMPTTMQLTATPNPNTNGWIQTAHITYQAWPTDAADAVDAYNATFGSGGTVNRSQQSLWSDSVFTDSNGDTFRFTIACDATFGYVVLARSYLTASSIQSHGGNSTSYRWLPGFSGNTCSPFSMTSGNIPGRSGNGGLASLVGPA